MESFIEDEESSSGGGVGGVLVSNPLPEKGKEQLSRTPKRNVQESGGVL